MKILAVATLMAINNHSLVTTSPPDRLIAHPPQTLIGLSCSPRKTCSRTVESCDEAYWLMQNCSWGGKLDRDDDGVPCENMCPGG